MPRTLFLGLNVLVSLLVFTALRVVFWTTFRNPADELTTATLLQAFGLGFKFDLRLALLLNLPLALLGLLPAANPFRSRSARRFWVGYFGATSVLVLLFYAVDLGHYGYLESRVDASVLRYLFDPRESIGVLWGSYPVVWGTLAIALAVAAHTLLLRRLFQSDLAFTAPRTRSARVSLAVAVTLLYAFGVYGKISYYPLRWSDAYFSTHAFASALSLNPLLYFYETFDNRDQQYDEQAVRDHYASVSRYLGVADPDAGRLDFTRAAGAAVPERRPLNVVIVLLESFAYYKTGGSGNPHAATPHFDAIAQDGVLFRR
ncbi:MAG: LTA synthase family protein, partial [Myxococcota bacterium]